MQINLLNYLGYYKTAEIIKNSVYVTLVHDKVHTKDLGGNATTEEITSNIINHVRKSSKPNKVIRRTDALLRNWKSYCNVPEGQLPK